MSRISFFQELLSSIFERGWSLASEPDKRGIIELCNALLSEKGEASGTKLTAALLSKYTGLTPPEKVQFFAGLATDFDLDPLVVADVANDYADNRTPENLVRLLEASEPKRQELLRRLNQVPGATGQLVGVREDLLALLGDDPNLARVDADFQHLFSSWFNRGFLVLRPIDWKTPANILEKIIQYEAVHAINDWDDLRRRLEPEDRRCFAFFHPVMPEEPLIFVEVALTVGLPTSIESVLAPSRELVTPLKADTAVFYSISNCRSGLKGVSFGNFLIKQVVFDLSRLLPDIKTFATLSPIPGFRRWLANQNANGDNRSVAAVMDYLSSEQALNADEHRAELAAPMKALAANYLLGAKRADGQPLDPVARFHLGNGAWLKQINWMADRSQNGLARSAGMMVNYLYDLKTLEANHEAYAREREINTTREIRSLLDTKVEAPATGRPEHG